MKILHTSDWHIGQKLHGNDREHEYRLFFDWLIKTINELKIDALLVAGDIFDVGFPSNSALKLYYTFLTRLIQTGCKDVIITGGNHDYISTLEAPAEVLAALNIHVVGGARENIEDEIILLPGEADQPKCAVAAVPFLRDKDIRLINAGESYDESHQAINDGIIRHYEQVAIAGQKHNCPLIAMGHLYMQGASTSDSERDIHIGNLQGLSVDRFPDAFDYIALGHIHRPQRLNEEGTVRYCGSPIPLSFSERKDEKLVVVVDLDASGLKNIETVMVPAFRKLKRFQGSFADISMALNAYEGSSELDDWAEVNVEEKEMDPSLQAHFEALIEQVNGLDRGLTVIKPSLRFMHNDENMDEALAQVSLSELGLNDVFERLLQSQQVVNKDEMLQSFKELVDQYQHQSETGE
jgi:exonuclease SbcD